MWSKTLVQFFPNMNGFLKNKNLKRCPTVWELLHHFIVVRIALKCHMIYIDKSQLRIV
jgi:hypothetical protein